MELPADHGTQSVARAVAIWRQIARSARSGLSLAELAAVTGLAKPTLRRILVALIREGMVDQDPASRRYFPGPETYVTGMLAAPRFGLMRIAQPALIRLARETGDTCFLTVPRGLHAVCLLREEGSHPVRTHALQPGDEHPLGIGAGSLAILAAMPDDEIAVLLDQLAPLLTMPRYAAYSPAMLRDAVAETRTRGHALNPGLIVPGSWGIGVAIRHPLGGIAGALSLAAIDRRLMPDRQGELAALLRAEASRAEKDLADLLRRKT
ncbi:IclR family transcriptional regulator [Paracoccus spongiarum]|uniref:IclR family transcriptional regulator n=1 Tax=Paracoccus spongiarum TaxID=3064387 RepID=A0ABT9JFD8_9RHOB|nr:IclR family transcriptional regulator [Paracoccus sp. 2205BS29-5]MDP5307802.1 IclR family transcriptional regulator [Paracoccus sp. 2205BS29-5]